MNDRLLAAFEKRRGCPSREDYGSFAGTAGLLCNAVLFVVKIIAGVASGSLSVAADAVNNLSDAGASLVTLLGFKLSKRPADKEHPYGHARIEYMSGAVIAIVILLIGGELLKSSIKKIAAPQAVDISIATLAALAAAIAIKLWMRSFYIRVADRINSTALRAAADDSRNDVFSTVGVLIGAVVQYIWNLPIDGWIGAGIAIFILVSGVSILKDSLSPLLGEAPPHELIDSIYKEIKSYDGVLGLHDLMVHSYGPERIFATVHVEMSASLEPMYCHGVLDNIERDVEKKLGVKLVIHLDPVAEQDEELKALAKSISEMVKAHDSSLSIHDFRAVKTHDHTNVIFDIAVPSSYKGDCDDLEARIANEVRMMGDSYYPVIETDRNYVEFDGRANGEEV